MGNLTPQTKAYIIGTLFFGLIAFASSALQWNWQEIWIQTIILSVLGALTLLFKVEGATDRTHYDITFVIYGFTLIFYGAPITVIMIVAAHMWEWIWHRYPWYIQSFNDSSAKSRI